MTTKLDYQQMLLRIGKRLTELGYPPEYLGWLPEQDPEHDVTTVVKSDTSAERLSSLRWFISDDDPPVYNTAALWQIVRAGSDSIELVTYIDGKLRTDTRHTLRPLKGCDAELAFMTHVFDSADQLVDVMVERIHFAQPHLDELR